MTIKTKPRTGGIGAGTNVDGCLKHTPLKPPCQAYNQVANIFFKKGEVCEIRALGLHGKGPWEGWAKGTVSGYFDDPVKLAAAVKKLDKLKQATGIYFCMNPVNPALLAKANNRLIVPKNTTTDEQVPCQRWLLIDTDPVRPPGISATNAELKTAIACRNAIADHLHEHGLPAPIRAYSGNGGHLLYKLSDLPNTSEIAELKRQSLQALKHKFDSDEVHVDPAVSNASRITKLYGTLARKGDSMSDRPHRRSYLEVIPEPIIPVTLEQLRWLAELAPVEKSNSYVHNTTQAGDAGTGKRKCARKVLENCCEKIRQSPPGDQHHIRRDMARLIGGYLHYIDEAEVLSELEQVVIASGAQDIRAAMKTVRDGLAYGKLSPIIIEDLQRPTAAHSEPREHGQAEPPDAPCEPYDGCSDTLESVEGIPPQKINLENLIIDSSQFANIEISEKKPFCSPWLKEQSINLVSGWRGCGKTWFILSLLNCVSQGQPFGPWTCSHAVPCLFLDGEMSVSDVIERTNLIGLHKERENSCFIYSDARANQYGLPRAHLTDMLWRTKMKKILIAKSIKLWAVDNLASLASGLDENCKKDWDPINQWLLELRFAGISTIMLHHMNKDGGQRGTSAREDNLDVSINLKKPHDYNPEDGARFIAHFTKARVANKNLQKISDTEFKLIENKSGQYIWTWGDVKKENKRAVLNLINDGIDPKTICETLNLSKGYVSKIKKKLLSDGHISTKGEITQTGFQMLHGL